MTGTTAYSILSKQRRQMNQVGKPSVFVYGTLKSGEPNHKPWLSNPENGQASFITTAITTEKYPLCIASKYNIPVLLDQPGTGYNIHGEIYEVDDQMLSNLDILEDHPQLYERMVRVVRDDTGKEYQCWIYLLKMFKPQLLEGQLFESYSSTGSHGLQYDPKYLRDPGYNVNQELVE